MAVKKNYPWPGESREPVDEERRRIAARWLNQRPPTPHEGTDAVPVRLLLRGPTDLRERIARAGWQRATRPASARSVARGVVRPAPAPPVSESFPPVVPEILPEAAVAPATRFEVVAPTAPVQARRGSVRELDWTPAISAAVAARDALASGVALLGSAILRSLRAGTLALLWLGGLLGRWLMAATEALGHVVIAAGSAAGAGALRVSGAAFVGSRRLGQAAWRGSVAAGAALGQAAATAGTAVARAIPRGWYALGAALGRAGAAVRGRASSVAAGTRAGLAAVADLSVAAGARVVAATWLRARQGGRFVWWCVSLPPILIGRAATAASRAVTGAVVRTGRATVLVARRTGRAVVMAPVIAVRGLRAGVTRASARVTTPVLLRRVERPAPEDSRIQEPAWGDDQVDEPAVDHVDEPAVDTVDELAWQDVEEFCDHERAGRAAICPECGETLAANGPARGRFARFGRDVLVAVGHFLTTVVFALLAVGIVVASVVVGAAIIAR